MAVPRKGNLVVRVHGRVHRPRRREEEEEEVEAVVLVV
jgi:hypothetical protein